MSPVEAVQVWWDGMTPEQRETMAHTEGLWCVGQDWSRSWIKLPPTMRRELTHMAYEDIAERDTSEVRDKTSRAGGGGARHL